MGFPTGIKVTDGCDLVLSYQCEGGYIHPEGIFSHVVDSNTRQLSLIVELPKYVPFLRQDCIAKEMALKKR